MIRTFKILFFFFLVIGFIALLTFLIPQEFASFLNPKGLIAQQERNLLLVATLLCLIAIVPVLGFAFFIAWRYRENNTNANYNPDWEINPFVKPLWWGVFCLIITVLGIVTWQSTHALDPFKPLEANVKPMRIQVVSLQWKWLFIYPEENIATVNYVVFPEKTPIAFELTADSPMNSFWIPQLGGQMYSMEGMVNKLHLIANEKGEFPGLSAEISGAGFVGMKFVAQATSYENFISWVQTVKQSGKRLSHEDYSKLAEPSENEPKRQYAAVEKDLYNRIVMKFMSPQKESEKMLPAMAEMGH